jgi:hydroxyacylglutathione hydrolase
MIFERFYLGCLSHASYLVGDEATGTAAVIDPQRDVAVYVEFAARHGLRIGHVFLTHFHADFIAGHLELRDRAGATIHLGAHAQAEYPFEGMNEGDAVTLGRVRLEVLNTPGHTPESISVVVYDLATSTVQPFAVLTGDTLFVGDVGRPDLRGSLGWSAADLGRLLFASLHSKLLKLPDATRVYPAHGAGSLCGKQLSPEPMSTIGAERTSNYALQALSEDQFIALVTADQPDAPAYFTYDAVLNAQERPTLESVLGSVLNPLSLTEVVTMQDEGATVLDVRDPGAFADSHLRGTVNIGLGGQYATWAGTLLSRERPIIIIADPGRESEAVTRLCRIGFDHIAGYLNGGMQALDERPQLIVHTKRVTPQWLIRQLSSAQPLFILDVRAPHERAVARIDHSVNIPLNHLPERLEEVPTDQLIIVHCAAGYRSSIAASLLQRHGFDNIGELAGGIVAWAGQAGSAG